MNTDHALQEVHHLLSRMSYDEMNRLLNDPQELNNFIGKLSEVQQLETVKRSLEERNKTLALSNLEKEPLLKQRKQKLIELHKLIGEYQEQYKKLGGKSETQAQDTDNPDMIAALLKSASTEAEQKTDNDAEEFFYGTKTDEELTTFERAFIEERKKAHELKIKADKFHDLLQATRSTSYYGMRPRFN